MPHARSSSHRQAAQRRTAAGIPDRATLGRRVRAAREALGLTQDEAGKRLGVRQRTYAKREAPNGLSYGGLLELIAIGYDPQTLCPELVDAIRENLPRPS